MEKYTPEIIYGVLGLVQNLALIAATAWTVVTLYKLSGSWRSLWALLMLLGLGSQQFIRD